METIQKILEFPCDTLTAIEELAQITGADGSPELIQDALRVFEWLVYQQAEGREVLAVPRDMVATVEADALRLAHLFEDDKAEDAKNYFQKKVGDG